MLRHIKVKGRDTALITKMLETGKKAPDFKLVNTHMNDVPLSHYKGHIIILAAMPSLDTPTCSLEASKFNIAGFFVGQKSKNNCR